MGKVLIYTLTEGRGGVEEYVLNLSRYRDNPGQKFGYIISGDKTAYKPELDAMSVDYFFVPKKRKLLSNIADLGRVLKTNRSDYETFYVNTSGIYYVIPYILAKRYGYKIILHSHSSSGDWPKSLIHFFNRMWVNLLVKERLACSNNAGKWMFGNRSYHLIPNAIDIDKFLFDDELREKYRRELKLEDSLVIGNIGRLHKGKNQRFILEILKCLKEMRVNASLVLVGDGDMRESLETAAKELEVIDRVRFIGQTRTSEIYYSVMDCFVMPSYVEGFPITLIEAQANGVPCIVSDTITQETNITGLVCYMSIKEEAQSWAKWIVDHHTRYNKFGLLEKRGFDVKNLWKVVDRYL